MATFSIAMVAACPFPANHGTPAAIREMSEALARRGHSIRVVTYPLHDGIPVRGIAIDRVSHVGWNRGISVGPSYRRLIFDLLLVHKLLQVVRQHHIELIHAHNYEAALVGGLSARGRRVQTGFARSYALSMLAGAAVLVVAVVLVRI